MYFQEPNFLLLTSSSPGFIRLLLCIVNKRLGFSLDQNIGCIAKKPNVPQLLLGMGYTANQSKCPTMFVGLMPVLQRLWEVYTLTNHAYILDRDKVLG